MKYFAYGSNMASARLRARCSSATFVGVYFLDGYDLRFHKIGTDGSAKCDAFGTGDPRDRIEGVVFELDAADIASLDRIEGVGDGYAKKTVTVIDAGGNPLEAFTYTATRIDPSLRPFGWYKKHVLIGALKAALSAGYIARIENVLEMPDPDRPRAARESEIHRY